MRRSYELYTLHSTQDESDVTYHVTLYKQPILNYLIAKLYHWYDSYIEKVPGVKQIDSLRSKKRLKHGWEHYIPPWTDRDVKCYHFTHKNRTGIVSLEVSADEYERLK